MARSLSQLVYTLSARLDGSTAAAFASFTRQSQAAGQSGARALGQTAVAAGQTERNLRAAAAGLATFQGPLGGVASRLTAVANLFRYATQGIALTLGGAAGGAALISAAAGIQSYQAKLVAATKDTREFATAQQLAFSTARSSRSDLGDTIQFYVRLASATKALGVDQRALFSTISTVQKSIQLSGAEAREATAAMQQFSQAIGSASGLGGDEFKSLGENANKVLQVIADGLVKINAIPGFDGTIGALKQLGAQGELTRDKVIPAIQAMGATVDQEFGRMPVTIQQATNQFKTSLTDFIIKTEETTGILAKSAAAVQFLADNFGTIATVAGGIAVAALSRFAVTMAAVAVTGIRAAAAIGAFSLGMAGVPAAVARTGAAMSVLRTASSGVIGLLGGPWGIALTAASTAALYLATRQDLVAKSADALGVSEADLEARVRKLTGRLGEQNTVLDQQLGKYRALATAKAQKNLSDARDASADKRGELFKSLQGSGAFAALSPQDYQGLKKSVLGGTPFVEIGRQIDSLAAKNRAFSQAVVADRDFIDRQIGRKSVADTLFDVGKADELAKEAQRQLNDLSNGVTASAVAASGSLSQGLSRIIAVDKARLLALGVGAQTLEAVAARRKLAIDQLNQEFKADTKGGVIGGDRGFEYAQRINQIEQTAKSERDAILATKTARTDAARQAKADGLDQLRATRAQIDDETKLANILTRFSDAPSRSKQVEQARNEIEALGKKRAAATPALPGYSDAELSQVEASLQRYLLAPLREANAAYQEQASIQSLILQGREADAEVLQRSYALVRAGVDASRIDLALIGQQVEADRARNAELARRNELVDQYTSVVGSTQSALTRLLETGNIGNFGKDLFSSFKASFARDLSFKLFGNAEQEARDRATGALTVNTDKLEEVRDALTNFQQNLYGGAGGGGGLSALGSTFAAGLKEKLDSYASSPLLAQPANDNVGPGVVPGKAGSAAAIALSLSNEISRSLKSLPGALVQVVSGGGNPIRDSQNSTADRFNSVLGSFGAKIDKTFGTGGIFEKLGGFAGSALKGVATGDIVNGIIGGSQASQIGGQIGGAIGSFIPIPGGNIIGSIIGNLVGKLFGVTPRAFQNINTDSTGTLAASFGGARGKGKDESLATAKQTAGGLIDSLNSLAQAFGASLAPNATIGAIGPANGKFEFKPGTNTTQDGYDLTKNPTLVFDTAQEAIAAALRSVVERGIITGLRDSTKRLLLFGNDIQAQVEKATKFEGVFNDLKQALDPVGFAVDQVNKKFTELGTIFQQAGASASEYAQLQQLYDLQRTDALNTAGNQTIATLKSYLTDLTTSASSGLSLRDRQSAALAAFNPLAADIGAGKKVDAGAYQTAAENLRQIEQELYGSSQQYFDRLSQITDLTRKSLADQTNVSVIGDPLTFGSPASVVPITDGLQSVQQAISQGLTINNGLLGDLYDLLANGGATGLSDQIRSLKSVGNY